MDLAGYVVLLLAGYGLNDGAVAAMPLPVAEAVHTTALAVY